MAFVRENTPPEFNDIGAEAIRLLCGDERGVDLAAIRRSLTEAIAASPGAVEELWWKWLVEAGRGLNYATRVIDATPSEVFELVRHGVEAVTLGAEIDSTRLLVLTATKHQSLRVCELPGNSAGRWISQRELAKVLGKSKHHARRWVVLDPVSDDMPEMNHNDHSHTLTSPWSRLREFLRPELSDLWIVLVFALVIGLLMLATPIAVESLVNTVAFGTLLQPLVVLSIILLTFLGFAAALRFLQRFVVELIQRRLLARVSARLAWQLPRVRIDRADEFSPELVNRFFDVVTVQKIVAQLLLDGVTVVLTVGLGTIVLAFYHPLLLAFDGVLLTLLVLNVFVLGRGAVHSSIVESRSKYAVVAWLQELARFPATFKSSGAAELALDRANRLTTDYLIARESHFRVLMRQIISGLALEALASAVLLGLGGFLVIRGQMTLGQLVAAELIVTYIVASVAKLDKQFEAWYDLLTSMDKLGHLFDLPIESSTGVMHVGQSGPARVSLSNMSYSHGDGVRLFDGLSLDANPGELVALTGPTGCGKSILFDLLFRMREVSSGRISLDDHDLGDVRPDVLRQHVALVRSVEVIDGTLEQNVHLDRPEITTVDVRLALRRVGLFERRQFEQDSLELSLATRLKHDGRPLSNGQALKLMLARAIVGKPRLLLIDGLFDVFPEDEAAHLLEQIKTLSPTCTILLATARESIAAKCDRNWLLR